MGACLRFEGDGHGAAPRGRPVAEARLWLGAVSMAPLEAVEAEAALAGRPLTEETIAEAARLAYPIAKPVDNTDFSLRYRKEMTGHLVARALRDLSAGS